MQPKSSAASAPRRGKPLATSCSRARLSKKKKENGLARLDGHESACALLPAAAQPEEKSPQKIRLLDRRKPFRRSPDARIWQSKTRWRALRGPEDIESSAVRERCCGLGGAGTRRSNSGARNKTSRGAPRRWRGLRCVERSRSALSLPHSKELQKVHVAERENRNFRKCTCSEKVL